MAATVDSISAPDRRARPTLVLIPGVQGRHEWLEPTRKALSRTFRVVSLSLYDGQGPEETTDPFSDWVRLIDTQLTREAARTAVVVGHSFGGLVAARYAAERPDRVHALVLASAPSPRMPLDGRARFYLRHPVLTLPLFVVQAGVRLAPEIIAAGPTWGRRGQLAIGHLSRVVRAPMAPWRMAGWVRAWQAMDLAADCARITAPTLVVTGEPSLDRVVPVRSSLDYLALISRATHLELPGTGHLGLVLTPAAFAAAVTAFSLNAAPPDDRPEGEAGDNSRMSSGMEGARARHD